MRYPAPGNKRETHLLEERERMPEHKAKAGATKGKRGRIPQTDVVPKVSEEPSGNEEKLRAAERLK